MRTVSRRKARNQPCKSPSPDVANRSVIKKTTIEVSDVKAKIRQAQSNLSMLSVEGTSSLLVHEQLSKSMEIKHRIFEEQMRKMRSQNDQLLRVNQELRDDNVRLKQGHNFCANPHVIISSSGSRQHLQGRSFSIDSQKRDLIQQINNQRHASEQNNRRIQDLQRDYQSVSSKNKDYQRKIIDISNSMVSFNQEFISKINELHSRINKLQTLKRVINEKHSRIVTESRLHKTPSTGKYDYDYKRSADSRNQSPQPFIYTYSPKPQQSNQDPSLQENNLLKRQLIKKQDEIQRLQQQRQHSLTFIDPRQQGYNSPSELDQLRTQNKALRSTITKIQNQHQQQRKKLLSIIDHHKSLLKGYQGELTNQKCQLCLFKDKQIDHLKMVVERNQLNYAKELSSVKEESGGEMKQSEQKHYEVERKGLSERCQALSRENVRLAEEVSLMRERMGKLGNRSIVDEASQLLDQNYTLYRDLDKRFVEEEESFGKAIEELRQKLYGREEDNIALQKQLSLKTKEVQVLQVELRKTKELQRQCKAERQQSATTKILERSSKNRHKIESNSKFRNNQLQLLDKIKDSTEQHSPIHSVSPFEASSPQ